MERKDFLKERKRQKRIEQKQNKKQNKNKTKTKQKQKKEKVGGERRLGKAPGFAYYPGKISFLFFFFFFVVLFFLFCFFCLGFLEPPFIFREGNR